MSHFDYDIDVIMARLDTLAREVPAAIPEALDVMADILVAKLKESAPYDPDNTTEPHLRDVIGKSGLRTSKKGNKYKLVFVKDRGEDDKNVYKAVVAEYGRSESTGGKRKVSYIPPRPFWRETVKKNEAAMALAGRKVIEQAIEKINKE